jgi:hypothetical protein
MTAPRAAWLGFANAEGGRRLVEDDHLRAECRCPRDSDGLALTAGERLDALAHVLERGDPELGHLLLSLLDHPAVVELAGDQADRPADSALPAEEHVACDVQGGRQREGLIDGLDPR